jgi:L-seryl-tRNA(Ser) seleniumtransferase
VPREATAELFRSLPSVDDVLHLPGVIDLIRREGHASVLSAVRGILGQLRAEIAAGNLDPQQLRLAVAGLEPAVERELRRALAPSLRAVVNATGVVLHTNLGRAPLAAAALEHIRVTAGGYSNLEYDLPSGDRGKRDVHVDGLLRQLLAGAADYGDAATIVVNNNAAAVLVALNTLAEGGEVVVSRGELVEIGGSFRIPDVMSKSGAVLREVGATNRTRLVDYEGAITDRTRLLLRVHRSNFQIVGFTEQPSLAELVALGRKHSIPVMEDLGSGALIDLRTFGLDGEPTVAESLAAGVDVVTYSGDKLLGGPQAGLISGRPELVARVRQNPLFRALRVDKLTSAALAATLLAYVKQDYDALPALRMLRLQADEIGQRAEAIADELGRRAKQLRVEIIDGESVVGGGAAPGATLPTRLLATTHADLSADELAARLRRHEPPVIARVEVGRVLLDLRTVFEAQDADILRALSS